MFRTTTNRPRSARTAMLLASACLLLLAAQPALARGVCTDTARAAFFACRSEVKDDVWHNVAICINLPDPDEHADCMERLFDERREAQEECDDQFDARKELCDAVGEDPYHPAFDPVDFDEDFTDLTNPNDYFPLGLGSIWEYECGDETIRVEVLNKTKLIAGVTCIVVNDVVAEDDEVIEDTLDWYAQAKDGAVHYCGELARDFEHFEDDDPAEAELVAIEGSFKAGRDGAKSGILMPAIPSAGETYRQEWALGDAEDAAEVLSTTYGYGDDDDLDEFVPQDLAELLCDDDCVVTRDFTPLQPDVEERKYYAPGIGLFLEVNAETGEIVQLVGCNFDDACDMLP